MREFLLPVLSLTVVLAIAACDASDPIAHDANTVGLPGPGKPASEPYGAPPSGAAPATPAQSAARGPAIPVALQGRWGLAPRDCTSSLGDAKGLLVVNGRELRFYESRAAPSGDVQASPDSISGTFDFVGEGQTWSKYQALRVEGRDLVRTETNPMASFNYAKCD